MLVYQRVLRVRLAMTGMPLGHATRDPVWRSPCKEPGNLQPMGSHKDLNELFEETPVTIHWA